MLATDRKAPLEALIATAISVGRIGIPGSILLQHGPLTELGVATAEFEELHPAGRP